jgi:hypothetical protein
MAGILTFARSGSNIAVAATTVTVTVTGNAGDVVVLGVRADTNITINTPTDNGGGNTWISLGASNNTVKIQGFLCTVVNGFTTITCTCASSTTLEAIAVLLGGEYKGGFTFAATSNGTGTNQSSMNVTSFSPVTHSAVVAFMTSDNASNFPCTADTGFTAINGTAFGAQYNVDESGAAEIVKFQPTVASQTLWVEKAFNLILANVEGRLSPLYRGSARGIGRGMR